MAALVDPIRPQALHEVSPEVQNRVPVTVLSYRELVEGSFSVKAALTKALKEQGIVGIRGIPRYQELVRDFIVGAQRFAALSEDEKKQYAPNRAAGEFTGYEIGAEKFLRADGTEVVDDSKASYYALVPDHELNKWPADHDLRDRYQAIGALMVEVGKNVMEQIGLAQAVTLAGNQVGRMLHYRKGCQADKWCGAHFDHGLFTALLPSVYFDANNKRIPEPAEAGLFVRAAGDKTFKKVVADDPDVMLFQTAEYGQVALGDTIEATEHEVRKPLDPSIERFTKALFFAAPFEFTLKSTSRLTQDKRWGDGTECSFGDWHTRSLDRYRAK